MCVEEKVIQNIQDAHVCEHIETFQFSYSEYVNIMMIFLRKLIIIQTKCFILFYLKNEASLADLSHTST